MGKIEIFNRGKTFNPQGVCEICGQKQTYQIWQNSEFPYSKRSENQLHICQHCETWERWQIEDIIKNKKKIACRNAARRFRYVN